MKASEQVASSAVGRVMEVTLQVISFALRRPEPVWSTRAVGSVEIAEQGSASTDAAYLEPAGFAHSFLARTAIHRSQQFAQVLS